MGETRQALALRVRHLRLNLDRQNLSAVQLGLDTYGTALWADGQLARGWQALDLGEALANATDDPNWRAMAQLRRLEDTVEIGDWARAQIAYDTFWTQPLHTRATIWQAHAAILYVHLRMGQDQPAAVISQALQEAKTCTERSGSRRTQQELQTVQAMIAMRSECWEEAAHQWQAVIALQQQSGQRIATPLAQLARVYAVQGQFDEARTLLRQARDEMPDDPPHCACAEVHLALGERAQAKEHALLAYQEAWGEGPPYIHWDRLHRTEQVLQALGEAEPPLPPCDPATLTPCVFEAEIRALITQETANRQRR